MFLLANPRSGSQEATRYTGLDFQNCSILIGEHVQSVLHVYNLVSADQRKKCFKKIVKIQKQSNYNVLLNSIDNPIHRVRLVIAGGDGSLIGAVTSAMEAGVDISRMPCCVLPFGTGNDLSRCTNWGGRPKGEMYRNLTNLMREICENSREEKLNVWSVKVTFKPRGGDTL